MELKNDPRHFINNIIDGAKRALNVVSNLLSKNEQETKLVGHWEDKSSREDFIINQDFELVLRSERLEPIHILLSDHKLVYQDSYGYTISVQLIGEDDLLFEDEADSQTYIFSRVA